MRDRSVRIWLWVGVAMVFVQVILGGVTRLTGSGLSITKWDIVTGTVPPLNAAEWEHEFALYQETPQYEHINTGMTMSQFRFIYFWEYFHRLWARSIGFVFLIPFLFFLWRRKISRALLGQLGVAVLLGAVVAAFGWIMVASGLVKRPWVNAYKLTIHLNLAIVLFVWLLWVAIGAGVQKFSQRGLKNILNWLTVLLAVQFILGGLMSGLKAAVYYPTWPDMYGELFPKVLINKDLWTFHFLFEAYEQGPMPGVVQFLHRITAYLIGLCTIVLFYKSNKYVVFSQIRQPMMWLLVMVGAQITLGILTVIHSVGSIPLVYGVMHQGFALIVLSLLVLLQRKITR